MSYQVIRKPIVLTTAVLFHLLLIFHLFFSPVIIVLASWKGIINASFIAFILISVLSIFSGRAYCSWFCPGCGIQEMLAVFIKRKARNSKANNIKYVIFSVWIGSVITGYIINGFHSVDLSYGMSDITLKRKIILTIGAVMIIVPLTGIFGRFASCKYVCWQAPFMILGHKLGDFMKISKLRLVTTGAECKNCGSCNRHCPMNIDVMQQAQNNNLSHTECILCGNCIDHCNHKVIRFDFKKKQNEIPKI
ncbi:MAG TPA: 4Fe-4S binding protein [Bacteroidales bacterium]|nr:4Fe-4S binding protein [Bacteroidales bacterium]